MGKISGLPDEERLPIIGYLAQEGVIREITAEVPLRLSDDFQSKYGIKPYIIWSDKKYSSQLRIYLNDPEDAPQKLKEALDMAHQRLNDNQFVTELVDSYGFIYFGKQDSRIILERAKEKTPEQYQAFLDGFGTNSSFISSLNNAVKRDGFPLPVLVKEENATSPARQRRGIHGVPDSNASMSEEQLLYLGWSGEEYLYRCLTEAPETSFIPFSINPNEVKEIIWYNEGYSTDGAWKDGSVGKGGDILVKTQSGDYLLEVKSSKRKSPIFGMTSAEMQAMRDLNDNYFLVKIDCMENLLFNEKPTVRVFKNPYARFFDPVKMQKAIFFCE